VGVPGFGYGVDLLHLIPLLASRYAAALLETSAHLLPHFIINRSCTEAPIAFISILIRYLCISRFDSWSDAYNQNKRDYHRQERISCDGISSVSDTWFFKEPKFILPRFL
jgi:hypothetical protein